MIAGLVAQQIGRVKNGHTGDAIPVSPLTPNFGDADGFFLEESVDGGGSGQDDNFGIDKPNLFHQVGTAGFHFVFARLAVAGGTALDDVAHENVVFSELDGFENFVEELA